MNLPGFNAEASLYTATEQYQSLNQLGEHGKQGIRPQDWPLSVRARADRSLTYSWATGCWYLDCFLDELRRPRCTWKNRCIRQ